MVTKSFLCTSQNGKRVYYEPLDSHASTHFADTPGLKELVIELLENKNIEGERLGFDVDMGRIVGTTDVVEVDDTDELVYAVRTKRFEQGLVPWVKSRPAQPCPFVSVALCSEPDGSYTLLSAWVGTWEDTPFPQEPHAPPESKDYWSKYAFVWGSQPIEPGTETSIRPW